MRVNHMYYTKQIPSPKTKLRLKKCYHDKKKKPVKFNQLDLTKLLRTHWK